MNPRCPLCQVTLSDSDLRGGCHSSVNGCGSPLAESFWHDLQFEEEYEPNVAPEQDHTMTPDPED